MPFAPLHLYTLILHLTWPLSPTSPSPLPSLPRFQRKLSPPLLPYPSFCQLYLNQLSLPPTTFLCPGHENLGRGGNSLLLSSSLIPPVNSPPPSAFLTPPVEEILHDGHEASHLTEDQAAMFAGPELGQHSVQHFKLASGTIKLRPTMCTYRHYIVGY